MADKIFIGKASQKTFNDGNSITNLDLNQDDIEKLNKPCRIEIKKSAKGNWYAEIKERPAINNQSTPVPF